MAIWLIGGFFVFVVLGWGIMCSDRGMKWSVADTDEVCDCGRSDGVDQVDEKL